MNINELDTPALLIDRSVLMGNIRRMQEYADSSHVLLRPHTKTHKMPYIAALAVENGASGIAVAKTGEAEAMAKHGLRDIFIANQIVGVPKLRRVAALSRITDISFGIDSVFQVRQAEQVFAECGATAEVLIEVEVGEVRCGIDSLSACDELISAIKGCPHMHLKGFFGHDGNSYNVRDLDECRRISHAAQEKLVAFAGHARSLGLDVSVVSYGSTPPLVNRLGIVEGITEIRPGTYALMDASQGHACGTLDYCAATVLATVISKPTDERVILDVGAKGITMQERTAGICNSTGKGLIKGYPGVRIERIFDEHAIINDRRFNSSVELGQKVQIIPVHICPVCNLYDTAVLVDGGEVIREIDIAARGKLK